MKFIHTADWHLGKTLKGQNLIDDQAFIIDQFFDIINDQNPNAILISGDIFDRYIPPFNAVDLFNDTLNRFAEKNIPTLIISGNHDSSSRLNFGSKIFSRQNIFIAAKISENPDQVVLEDDFGEIYFSLIPFFVPSVIKEKFFDETAERLSYNDANRFYIELARKNIPKNKRSIALAHVFITGGVESKSERKFVGGSENVDANIFKDYNYVALGHLHSPQKVSNTVHYAGSPLKYSFDEANHNKSVSIIDIDGSGAIKINKIPLKPRRDLIIVEGKFKELKNLPTTQDYAQIILMDDAYSYNTEQLRDAFPNFLEIKRKGHLKSYDDVPNGNFNKEDTILEQFAKFFEEVTNEPLNNDEQAAFEKFLAEMESEQ